jgi:hypothetical protein
LKREEKEESNTSYKNRWRLGIGAHACYSSYSVGKDGEDPGLRPTPGKKCETLFETKPKSKRD